MRIALIALAVAACTVLPGAPAFASTHPASSPPPPPGKECTPAWTFKVTGYHYQDLGNPASSAWSAVHNNGSSSASLAVSYSTDSSVGYSVTASVSAEAGIIFASASTSASVGISYTHTDSVSNTVTVTVPAHEYGEAGVGNNYDVGTGTLTYL
jgi:hypothetical protein